MASPNTQHQVALPKRGKAYRLMKGARNHLNPNEAILGWVQGSYETEMWGGDTVRKAIMIATSQRVYVYASKMIGHESESFPYSNISSIESGKSMMGKYISFFASGNKAVIKWIRKGNAAAFEHVVRERMQAGSAPTQQQPQSAEPDPADLLAKLSKLHKAGAVTDEEFEIKKADLLERM